MIQGKEALVGLDKDNYKLVTVPEIPKEENVISESIVLTVDNRNLVGSSTATLSGYRKVFAQYKRLQEESEDDKKFFNEFLRKGNNKFEVTKVSADNFFNREKEGSLQYEFTIPDYAKKAGRKLYINLNLIKTFQNKDIDIEKRKLDKKVEFKHINEYKVELTIPEGYEVDYLPESNSHKDAEFGFDIIYQQKGDKVFMHQQIFRDHLMLRKERFEAWNEMMEKLKDSYQEVIVLKKTS